MTHTKRISRQRLEQLEEDARRQLCNIRADHRFYSKERLKCIRAEIRRRGEDV